MEENTSRPLIIAAGLILAMLIIALAFGIYNTSKDTANDAVSQITNLSTTLAESEFTQWEGQTVTGSQVVSLIKQFQTDTCAVVVDNNGAVAGGVTNYGYVLTSGFTTTTGTLTNARSTSTVAMATDKTNSGAYVTPSASFTCTVIRDANTEAIVGLYFTKQ